jgi:orotate phosphoribosyltransferase-like protein
MTRTQSNKIDPRNKIVGDVEKRVLELREKGLTVKEIAEDIKIASKATVSRFLRNKGL